MAQNAWQDIHTVLSTAPDLAPINVMLGAQLTQALGKPDVMLADLGMSPQKGMAYFALPGKAGLAILPVVDRDKFLAAAHGTKGEVDHLSDTPVQDGQGRLRLREQR